jgi:GNAT superfamily N-acetyltransferase
MQVLALACSRQGTQGIIAAALANGNDARYHLVAADLRCTEQLDAAVKAAALDLTTPTLICIECVLCYLQPHEAAAVLAWAAATFKRGSIVTHEPAAPLHAADAYGSALAAAFTAQGCPIACPTGGAVGQCKRLYAAGWEHAAAVTAHSAAARWLAPAERARVAHFEPFDEVVALAAVQERYAVAVGSHSASTLQQLCRGELATSTGDERAQRLSDELTLLETRAAALEAVLQQRRTAAVWAANGVTLQWSDSWQSSSSDVDSIVTAIRELFKQGLSDVGQQYSAVRKFIKSVLNSDLGTGKQGLLHCYAHNHTAAETAVEAAEQQPAARMLLALANAQQPLDDTAAAAAAAATSSTDSSSSSSAAASSSQQVIIGCAAVANKGSGLVELKRMSVAPQWRSCGIGSALLSECESCARSDMAATEVVLTTLAPLTAARRMYTAHGFAAVSKTDLGQGLYAYEYSKTLAAQGVQ